MSAQVGIWHGPLPFIVGIPKVAGGVNWHGFQPEERPIPQKVAGRIATHNAEQITQMLGNVKWITDGAYNASSGGHCRTKGRGGVVLIGDAEIEQVLLFLMEV